MLAALSPVPAITYLWHAGPLAFVVIGGAFLAVTGGEAFYADMGHFGPSDPVAWFAVALPALTLNYFGQGGLLLAEPNNPPTHRQSVLRACAAAGRIFRLSLWRQSQPSSPRNRSFPAPIP